MFNFRYFVKKILKLINWGKGGNLGKNAASELKMPQKSQPCTTNKNIRIGIRNCQKEGISEFFFILDVTSNKSKSRATSFILFQ